MAESAGKDAVFKITTDAGLIDLTPYLTSISGPSTDAQVAEISTLGDAYKSYIRTQVDPGAITVEGVYQTLAGTALAGMVEDEATAFEFYPQGTAAGNSKLEGSCMITSFEPGNDRDDASLFSAGFTISGTLTHGTA